MILSDVSIWKALDEGTLKVFPLYEDSVKTDAIDLHLSPILGNMRWDKFPRIDPRHIPDGLVEHFEMKPGGFWLRPHQCILGATVEHVILPNNLTAQLDGKSTIGRLFLKNHSQAGRIDAGFSGTITFEISNDSGSTILLYPDMPIAQLVFEQLTTSARYPYGHVSSKSHYQGQVIPMPPASLPLARVMEED